MLGCTRSYYSDSLKEQRLVLCSTFFYKLSTKKHEMGAGARHMNDFRPRSAPLKFCYAVRDNLVVESAETLNYPVSPEVMS